MNIDKEILEAFERVANIEFVENNGDVEIGEMMTADGYAVHYMTTDVRNLQWDQEVFYYKPDFDDIMSYIGGSGYNDAPTEVCVYDFDEYFDEYYIIDYLSSELNEDELDKLGLL